MKKYLAIVGLVALTGTASAQTNTPGFFGELGDFLSHGSNYWVEAAASFAPDLSSKTVNPGQFGGEFDFGIKATEWLQPVLGLAYFQSQLYAVSGTLQLSPPQSWLGKIPVTPYAHGGVAVGVSGLGNINGTPIGVIGAGGLVKLDWLGSGWFWQHSMLDARYDRWVGMPQGKGDNILVGLRINF